MPIGTRSLGPVPEPRGLDVEVLAAEVDRSPSAASKSAPITSTASESIEWRAPTAGQPSPTTCSFRFSPAPSPRRKRPPERICHRRRLLGDDRRVVADRRAGDVGHQADPLGHRGGGAEHRPGVGRVALLDQPGLVVVGDLGEVEARRLGALDVGDERVGRRLLAHHRVAEFSHAASVPGQPAKSRIHSTPCSRRAATECETSAAPTSRSSASREAAGEERQGRHPGRLRRDHVPGRVADHQRRAARAELLERHPHQFGIGLAVARRRRRSSPRRSAPPRRAARRSDRTRPPRRRSR